MVWLIIIIIIVVSLFIYRAGKGPIYTLSSVDRPIRGILRQGFDKGFAIIHISYSKKFIQFRKYIKKPGDYGIVFSFPKTKWSKNYYNSLLELCREANVEYTIIPVDQDNSLEFMEIDFAKDYKSAAEFSRIILISVFKVKENVKLFATLGGGTHEDILVDR